MQRYSEPITSRCISCLDMLCILFPQSGEVSALSLDGLRTRTSVVFARTATSGTAPMTAPVAFPAIRRLETTR